MRFFDGLLRPRKDDLVARPKSSVEIAHDHTSTTIADDHSPALQRKKKRQRRPEVPGARTEVRGLGISVETALEAGERPVRAQNREEHQRRRYRLREETPRDPQNAPESRQRRHRRTGNCSAAPTPESAAPMRERGASDGVSERPLAAPRRGSARLSTFPSHIQRPSITSVAAGRSADEVFVDASEPSTGEVVSAEQTPEASSEPSSEPITPTGSSSGTEGAGVPNGALNWPLVDPTLSPTQAYGFLIRPPPLDEYSEIVDEIPPYREALHKFVDVVLFDLRFGPILRVNRFLIKDDIVLQNTIENFEKFQVIPRNINLNAICHIDDDEYDAMIPALLGYASGDIALSPAPVQFGGGSAVREEERSERRRERQPRNNTEGEPRSTTEGESRNTTERESRREARAQREARRRSLLTQESTSRNTFPSPENTAPRETRAEREAHRQARMERRAHREARRNLIASREAASSEPNRQANRNEANRERRGPRRTGSETSATEGTSRASRRTPRAASRPSSSPALTAGSGSSQRRNVSDSRSMGIPNFPAEALAAYAAARTTVLRASINDDYLYALYLTLVEQGVSFNDTSRAHGIPVQDYLTPPAYRSVVNV